MKIYAFDIDDTLEISARPVRLRTVERNGAQAHPTKALVLGAFAPLREVIPSLVAALPRWPYC